MYLNYRLEACASPVIAEKDLLNIMDIIMNNIIPQKNTIIESMLELYKNIDIILEKYNKKKMHKHLILHLLKVHPLLFHKLQE